MLFTLENVWEIKVERIKDRARVLWNTQMEGFMKANGKMTQDMGEDMKGTLMKIYTKVNFNMEKLMAKEDINGFQHLKFMMVNGQKGWDMDMEFGKELVKMLIRSIKTHTLESGETVKLRDMVSILGAMAIDMKVNGKNVWKMVEEQIFLQMGISTQVNIKMESQMAMVFILGLMAITMMGNF